MKQKLLPFKFSGETQSNFYVDPRTQILYFKKGHAGQKIKFSTKLKAHEFIKARRVANQEFNKRIGKEKKIIPRTLIKDELALWLKVKESENHVRETMNNVNRAARQIEEFWGGLFPSEITRDNLAHWYAWWKDNHPDIEMENVVKYMRNFCRYLNEKIIDDRPLLAALPRLTVPNAKEIRRRRKKNKEAILTADDFKKIMATAESDLHRLLVLFMYTMGTRVTETLHMRLGHEIDLKKKIYRWSDGQNKANLDGWHYLHPSLVPYFKSLNHKGPRVFPQKGDTSKAQHEQQIAWERWRERARLSIHWTPHTFRHTCLSNLFNDPQNPQAVICKLYRVSLRVAMDTYIKPTEEGREKMSQAIKVEL